MSFRAKVVPVAFDVICPKCDAPMDGPKSSSTLWNVEDFRAVVGGIRCSSCRVSITIPIPAAIKVWL